MASGVRSGLHITATIQISNLGGKLLADAAATVEARETDIGDQEALKKSMDLVPRDLNDVSEEEFDEMRLGSLPIL